jgi:hypothetical protein
MLAINRCLSLLCSDVFVDRLFKGKRTWVWMAIPTAYGIYVFIFEKSVIFTGTYASWFFNPHVGFANVTVRDYESFLHPIHNGSVAVLLVVIYSFLAAILVYKINYIGHRVGADNIARHKMVHTIVYENYMEHLAYGTLIVEP